MDAIYLLGGFPLLATILTAWNRSLAKSYFVTVGTAAVHLAITLHLLVTQKNSFSVGGWFAIDLLGTFFLTILSHTFLMVALYSPTFLKRMEGPEYDNSKCLYYPALNFYLFANTLVITTQHFGLLWVIMEMTTFSLVPLIYFYRSKESLEATWKYLFLSSLGLVFLLIGILFLGLAAKGIASHTHFVVRDFVSQAALLNPFWMKASFVLALVGLSVKIGLAPMHPSDIDATANAPAPIAALIAGSQGSTALLVLLRFYQIVSQTSLRALAQQLLILAGIFSLLVAMIYIWRSQNYKRLLAYSSIEHFGIITLAIGVGGAAILGAFLHVLFNSFGKAVLFFMAGNIHREFRTREIEPIQDLIQRLPWSGFLWGLASFYLMGIPPFGPFFSELWILQGMIDGKNWIVPGFFLGSLLILFIGMSRLILSMLQKPSPSEMQAPHSHEHFNLSHALGLYALVLSIPIALFQPKFLFEILRIIVANFGFVI